MKITILGCGPSAGMPMIGNDWGDCDPNNPRNRRRRASILVQEHRTTILVDTSPDMRLQLLDAGISRLDAILFTHAHADHTHGIDEVRALNRSMGEPMPIYASPATLAELRQRFAYIFRPQDPAAGAIFYKPALIPQTIDGPFEVAGIAVTPFTQEHGYGKTLGFRFGAIAYSTDVVALDQNAFAALEGVEVWIVDCYRRTPHPTHTHLAQTLEWIDRIRPKRAILTHMDRDLDYETLRRELPSGVEPAYDGLVIDIP
ncbi:MAG TPA: MBL fold metallo-hydrolase [Stellaceae bacterium]|nr:MBL fold metallo-hydrolase [Stellaceae bacterium]